MASSSTQKKCSHDNYCKQDAVTNCMGCSKGFCMKHMSDHRRSLENLMKPIISGCDLLKKTLNQQAKSPDSHILLKEIDNWEKESIAKIQERAKKLRQFIQKPTATHTSDLLEKHQQLSEQLEQHRKNNNYIETDIENCQKKLEALVAELTSPLSMHINRCNNGSLVNNISVSIFKIGTELFDKVSDSSVRIDENGQVAVRVDSNNCTEIRGKEAYVWGCHEIRLHFEGISNSWTFLGVNSKSTEVQKASNKSESTYGWSSDNYTWSNGKFKFNGLEPRIEIENDDTISLLFDCNNHTIAMVNKRTNAKHEMIVDVLRCPLPWQIHVILHEPNSRVRILPK